jgi:hypothetical protein
LLHTEPVNAQLIGHSLKGYPILVFYERRRPPRSENRDGRNIRGICNMNTYKNEGMGIRRGEILGKPSCW